MVSAQQQIRVPRETVNDDTVRIVRWLAAGDDVVRFGTVVVELETSKSVIAVESPATGRLTIHRREGEQVLIGEVLGLVTPDVPPVLESPFPTASALPQGQLRSGRPTISAKARALMMEHGLDESVFGHLPLVREADVQSHLASLQDKADSPTATDIPSVPPEAGAGSPAPWQPKGLLGEAARASTERGTSVIWLCFNYLWRNWLLGNLVRIAPRGIITVLHRWRGVRIGHDCYIDPNAILETAYPENITLGNDVRVTAGAIIMTHVKGPHYLRDQGFVPFVLKKVTIEDHAFIGVNAVLLPGVTVGRAAVVVSGAVVTTDVPPFTVVAGNPAKVVKRFEQGNVIS